MTYGNGLVETSTYNNRLQPTQLRTYNSTTNADVLNLTYGFTNSAGVNNGNVVTFNSTATQIFMRTYTYDELNRLSTMSSPADASGCYGLSWTYDAWGNRLSQNPAGGSGSACVGSQPTIYTNNRIIDPGYVHDAAGNMTSDNVHTYAFNAESQLTQVDSGSTATYLYDANGQRVRKTTGGVATDYVYDGTGLVAEIQGPTWTKGYVHSGTQLVAQYNGAIGTTSATTLFSLMDHLGSTRILSTVAAGISDSMDYLPYGELISGGSSTTHKFTGKERDAESGLDDFDARYYSSNLGRFVSADWSATPEPVPYADFGDPQSLNLYTYVRNLPTTSIDANGHCTPIACVYEIQNFVNNLGSYEKVAKDFVVGAGKQAVNTAASNWGAKSDVLPPSNSAQQAGADAEKSTMTTMAVVLPLVTGVEEGETSGSFVGPKEGSSGGEGAGKDFSPATKQAEVDSNAAANGGSARCVYCGEKVSNEPGPNKVNLDHAQAKANGGNNSRENAQVACQYCNQSKGTAAAPKNPKPVKIKPPDQN